MKTGTVDRESLTCNCKESGACKEHSIWVNDDGTLQIVSRAQYWRKVYGDDITPAAPALSSRDWRDGTPTEHQIEVRPDGTLRAVPVATKWKKYFGYVPDFKKLFNHNQYYFNFDNAPAELEAGA